MDKLWLAAIPSWIVLVSWIFAAIVVWVAYKSRPYWLKAEAAANKAAEARLPAVLAAAIREGIDFAEETFYGLTGPQRMTRCLAYLARVGIIVTEEQVQAVFDVEKKLGFFDKKPSPEAA